MKETVDLRIYLSLLWRRKWMVLIPTLIAGIAGFVVTMPKFMKPVFQCKSTLLVEQPLALNKGLEGLVSNPSAAERIGRLESQMQSTEFLTRIIDNTGMREDRSTQRWAERNQKKYPDMTEAELVELKLLRYLRGIIRMKGNSNQIQVSVMDYYPERSYLLVKNITAAIIEANRSTQMEQFKSTEEFSNTQLLDYKRRLDEAESRLEDFRENQANQSVTPSLVDAGTLPHVSELRRMAANDLERFKTEKSQASSSLASLGVNVASVNTVLGKSDVAGIVRGAKKLEQSYVRQSLLEAEHPDVSSEATAIQLARSASSFRTAVRVHLGEINGIDETKSAVAEEYLFSSAQADLAQTRLSSFDRHIREFSQRVTSMPEADLALRRLEQEVEQYRTLYNVFEQQLVTTKISEAFESSQAADQITIIEPPQQPLKPVKPKRGPMIVLGFIAGLTIGVLGSFVLEHHDQTFRNVEDTEQRLGIRVIGTIPVMDGMGKKEEDRAKAKQEKEVLAIQRLHQFLDDSPGYLEFRKTALSLLRAGRDGPRSLLITSARSAEGKSTASTCLSLAMAKELSRERILLMDFDARKPALASKLGIDLQDRGDLSSMLLAQEWNEQAVLQMILPNFHVLPMREVRDGAGEVITQETTRWAIREALQRFDRIVIDSPPNLPVPDPLILGPEVEAVLMVVKAGVTPRETVRRSLELQRQFQDNVWGILMNNVAEALPYYYSYKHYGYGYGKRARG